METRIAVTPSEGTVIHHQILSQCYSGLLYLPVSRDSETGRSVFEIRGYAPDPALEVLKQRLTLRGAVFEIFEVEATVVTKYETSDVKGNELEVELAEPAQLPDTYETQDKQGLPVVARA